MRDVRGNVKAPAARAAIIPVLHHTVGPISVEEIPHLGAVIFERRQAIEAEPCLVVAAITRAAAKEDTSFGRVKQTTRSRRPAEGCSDGNGRSIDYRRTSD